MTRPPPRSTQDRTLFPYTTLFRSPVAGPRVIAGSIVSELAVCAKQPGSHRRSEEHTSELQSHGLISYAVFCSNKKTHQSWTGVLSNEIGDCRVQIEGWRG